MPSWTLKVQSTEDLFVSCERSLVIIDVSASVEDHVRVQVFGLKLLHSTDEAKKARIPGFS